VRRSDGKRGQTPGAHLADRPEPPAAPATETVATETMLSSTGGADPGRRAAAIVLAAILLIGGGLRLAYLDSAPAGWNVDEAANAWNAYCLLKTGMDQHGEHWPIFSIRCFGEHRTVWYAYCLLPFQAVGGMNLWTTRLPAALGGILTLVLVYVVGRRMFGRSVGLVAAALLAVNPWHIHLCRLGHEASLAPLQILATFALALRAGLPLGDSAKASPRRLWAIAAGAFGGACCYGYFPVRLFLPLLLGTLTLLVIFFPRARGPRDRRAVVAMSAGALAFLLVLAPLVVKHLTDPEMNQRGQWGLVWEPSDPWLVKAGKALAQYPVHFGPDFLFVNGDANFDFNPARAGAFSWYMLPLMLVGLGWCAWRIRQGRSCLVLLLWLAIFPAGDLILPQTPGGGGQHVHYSPGLPAMVLLGAAGAVAGWHWLRRRSRNLAVGAALATLCAAIVLTASFANAYYRLVPARGETRDAQHAEVAAAARYVGERLRDVDVVVVYASPKIFMPYIFFVVAMEYDPRSWFADPPQYGGGLYWDVARFGKVYFLNPQDDPGRLLPPSATRLLVVVLRGPEMKREPVYAADNPSGPTVRIYEMKAKELYQEGGTSSYLEAFRAKMFEEARALYDRKKSLPATPENSLETAKAAVDLISWYGAAGRLGEAKALYDAMKSLPATPEINAERAKCAVNLSMYYCLGEMLGEARALYDEIMTLPATPEINLARAKAAFNLMKHYDLAMMLGEAKALYQEVKSLPATPEINLVRAQAAVNLIPSYGKAGRIDEARALYEDVKSLPAKPEINLARAQAAVNMLSIYGRAGRIDEAKAMYEEMKSLPGTPDIEKVRWIARKRLGLE
jgi:pentatricopeptide repeat protein